MVMRRPPLCTSFSNDNNNPVAAVSASPELKESKLSKVKRIITGSILLGRKSNKAASQPRDARESSVCTTGSPERQGDDKTRGKGWTEVKAKGGRMGKRGNEENMDTDEGGGRRNEVSICLTKDNGSGKKVKEICIEITQNQPSAVTEIVVKPRKRKERLDSGGSTKQEHKVIRSSSEERPERAGKEAETVRRVSSHEELSRAVQAGEQRDAEDVEEDEHERRRSYERASRAPRGRRNLQKKRTKGGTRKKQASAERKRNCSPAVEAPKEDKAESSPDSSTGEREEEPSSPLPMVLDLSTLHRQMEGGEPLTSRGKTNSPQEEAVSPSIEALISPRNSLVGRLAYLDPSMPPSPPRDHRITGGEIQDPQERRMAKKINSIKRQLKRYEEGFKEEFGFKPSHADKMANKDIKKMVSDLTKLKTQLKQYKDDAAEIRSALTSSKQLNFLTSLEGGPHNTSPNPRSHKNGKSMEEVLHDVEKRLQDKRELTSRSDELSAMNRGDLLEEKLAVQKALLHLENVFGRPVTSHDRDLVRPLYQRYRTLKRMVTRNSAAKLNNSTGELATILEHETMEFASSGSGSVDLGDTVLSAPEGLNLEAAPNAAAAPAIPQDDVVNSCSSSSESASDSNLHALPLSQLLEQQKAAREEKKKLRRNLREFEEKFQQVTGRRATKADRMAMEDVYVQYKQSKARLRLVNALVVKKSCRKRNSC